MNQKLMNNYMFMGNVSITDSYITGILYLRFLKLAYNSIFVQQINNTQPPICIS